MKAQLKLNSRRKAVRLAPSRPGAPGRARAGRNPVLPPAPAMEVVPGKARSAGNEGVGLFQPDTPRGDALQLYLREIGQVKLLTPQEEIVLARRIKRGTRRLASS